MSKVVEEDLGQRSLLGRAEGGPQVMQYEAYIPDRLGERVARFEVRRRRPHRGRTGDQRPNIRASPPDTEALTATPANRVRRVITDRGARDRRSSVAPGGGRAGLGETTHDVTAEEVLGSVR